MKSTFLSLILLLAEIVIAQNVVEKKTWGLIIGPQVTSHKFPHGSGVSYSDGTTTNEISTTQFAGQVYFSTQFTNTLGVETNFGFSKYGAATHFHYESAPSSSPRVQTVERRISYAGVSPKVFYVIKVGSFSFSPFVGLSANLIVGSIENYIFEINGGGRWNSWNDVKDDEVAIKIAYDAGIKTTYPVSKKVNLEIRPFYNHFLKGNYTPSAPDGKVFSGYGILLGFSLKR